MNALMTTHPRRLALLAGLLMASALFFGALMASPAAARKPGGGGGGTTYEVAISGDVATVPASFITVGNGPGTKLGGDPVKTSLDLTLSTAADPDPAADHQNFGANTATVNLDGVEWDFKFIDIGKDRLVARFDRHGVYESENGFDDYTLRFRFELDEDDGPTGSANGVRVYTSKNGAGVAINHYAETDDPSRPKGKKDLIHQERRMSLGHDITVTITPVGP